MSVRGALLWAAALLAVGIVSAPVLAAGAGWVVGSALPERTEGSASRYVAAPPDAVWAVIAEPMRVPLSTPVAVRPLDLDAPLPTWEEDLGDTTLVVRTLAATPPTRLVREVRDTTLPMTLTLTTDLTPEADGTLVTSRATLDIADGGWQVPIFRVIVHGADVARTAQEAWLERVAVACDASVLIPTERP